MRSATIGRQTPDTSKALHLQHSENRNIWSKPGLTTLMVDVYTPNSSGNERRDYDDDISPTIKQLRKKPGSVSSLRQNYESGELNARSVPRDSITESNSSDTELISMPRKLPSFSSSKDVELRNAARFVQLAKTRYRTLSSTSGDERRDVVTAGSITDTNSVDTAPNITTIKIPTKKDSADSPAREKSRKPRQKSSEKPSHSKTKDAQYELADTIEELDKLSRRDSWIRNKLKHFTQKADEKKPGSKGDKKHGKTQKSSASTEKSTKTKPKRIIDIVISPTAIYTNNKREIISIESLGKIVNITC